LIAAAGDHVARRFLEFFAANIRNPHTLRAYGRAVGEFLALARRHNRVPSVTAVQPLHVAGSIEMQTQERDRRKFGGQAAIACGCGDVSLAGWNLCP
jgi:hypothetical protein